MAQPTIEQTFDVALQHHQAGRLHEAERLYRQILAQQPEHIDAMQNLGIIAQQAGRTGIAVDLIRRAIALRPNYAEAYSNLGNALKDNGQLDEAIAACRQAIALKPDLPEAHSNLGAALLGKGQFDEAIAACRRAISLRPNLSEAHASLGAALAGKGELDEAAAAFRRAIALKPSLPEAHGNLGNALRDKGQLEEAVAAYRQAISLRPAYAEAHIGLALSLLARGDFRGGWDEYEWRWKCEDFPSPGRNFARPQWDGCPLEARTLVLHAEQGYGDAIQFIRYLPLVEQRGGRIIIECPAELQRLFQTIAGRCQIVAAGQSLPPFDLHCPILSLPLVFKTTLESIPAEVPYLFPDAELLESWRQKLSASAAGLKVALAWAGNPNVKVDRARSMSLDRLAPLSEVRGATFYSLQKGEAARQAEQPPPGLRLVNLGPELHDFADTAAVMCLMDLVITTDTSVAHLAGALGRPVWVMLQFMPDWRWLLDRDDSPWYPTMRLFRQSARGDWDSVITRVAEALSLAKE
ncbi:MAG: tetratricopeptide repeat protein [Tepidisphaeraceae bacterium]